MLHRLVPLSLMGAALLFSAESAEARGRKGGCGGGSSCSAGGGGGGCGGGRQKARGGRRGGGASSCGMGGCGMSGSMGGCGSVGYGGCGGGQVAYGAPGMGYGPGTGTWGTAYAGDVSSPTPANLLVSLPADARLFVDGHETQSTSGERLLTTPDLQPGREYSYTLRAEVTRDGQTQQVSQRVTVRAGEETRVNIEIPTAVASR